MCRNCVLSQSCHLIQCKATILYTLHWNLSHVLFKFPDKLGSDFTEPVTWHQGTSKRSAVNFGPQGEGDAPIRFFAQAGPDLWFQTAHQLRSWTADFSKRDRKVTILGSRSWLWIWMVQKDGKKMLKVKQSHHLRIQKNQRDAESSGDLSWSKKLRP